MPISLRWTVLAGAILALIIGPFVVFEEAITTQTSRILAGDLHPGLAATFISALLALDVLLPVPSSLVSTASGALLGFGAGTLVCWLGMTLGCLLGHWIGATGGTAAVRRLLGDQERRKAAALAERFGWSTLVLTRAVPVLAEASTIAAGAVAMPLGRFVLVTGLANLGIAAVYAGIGAYAFAAESFLLAFAGALLVPGAALLGHRLVQSTAARSRAGALAQTGAGDARHLQSFAVPFAYPVHFVEDVLAPGDRTLADAVAAREPERRHAVTVMVDSAVAEAWPDLEARLRSYVGAHPAALALTGSPITVPGGEACKNDPALLQRLYRHLRDRRVDRHGVVLAIGGGAMLDLVGYAAATTHRGVRLIRMPTTVLAQNDSGVGVKNGINLLGLKNFVGTFAPPFAVINDFAFLESLPARDRRGGLAEAVKVALIRDRAFYAWLEREADALVAFEPAATRRMIRRCAKLHMRQIAHGGDPFETGSARPLDFGHWAAHKLESLTRHELRHGEAVAIGIALDTRYSVLSGRLRPGVDGRICGLLERLGFALWHAELDRVDGTGRPCILDGLREFREHLGGELTVTLLSDVGVGVEVHELDEALVLESIRWLAARAAG